MTEHLFLDEQHPISRRFAVLEDDGNSAWLYLTEPNGERPCADAWVYDRIAPPSREELSTPAISSSERQRPSVGENRTFSLGSVLLASVQDVAAFCWSRISSVPKPGFPAGHPLVPPARAGDNGSGSTLSSLVGRRRAASPMRSRFMPRAHFRHDSKQDAHRAVRFSRCE